MFLKPFRIKSQTAIKGSDRKKLRQELGRQYPGIDEDELDLIVPSKEEMLTVKIYTHSGQTALIYMIARNPVFFELETTIYPTVYTVWKYPTMMPVFATWPDVLTKIIRGADLMLPGVVTKGPPTAESLGNLRKRALCAVKLVGNRSPIAVGKTAISSEDMYEAAMRGKGVLIMHCYKDYLWAHGDKSDPPMVEDPEYTRASAQQRTETSTDGAVATTSSPDGTTDGASLPPGETFGEAMPNGAADAAAEGMERLTVRNGGAAAMEEESEEEEETGGQGMIRRSPQEKMDELLLWCFKSAIKMKVTKSDLPLLTSKFQRVFLQACCPKDKYLDLKVSSYKKLSKFLSAMHKDGYIAVKELSKGVDSITEIHKDHKELRSFKVELNELPTPEDLGAEGGEAAEKFQPPQIAEMYLVNSNTLPLFKSSGHAKGRGLSAQAVRKVLVDYVKENELQDPTKKGFVRLDPVLSHMVLAKDDHRELMRWEDIMAVCLSKMGPGYQISYPGQLAEIKKGKLEPIVFNTQARAGNKKVTLVENLETYGIDPAALAHDVQVGMACSASVAPNPAKKKGHMLVTVQGNQINYIAQILTDKYGLQRKWLQGLDKAPKAGKKRR